MRFFFFFLIFFLFRVKSIYIEKGNREDYKMEPFEEQLLELEVLESIYPDELTKFSDKHFGIKILLDTGSERKHEAVLNVKYPEEYPSVIADLDIDILSEEKTKLEDDLEDTGAKALDMAEDVVFEKEDKVLLLNKLIEEANTLVGMPMVFALITQLKDELENIFRNRLDQAKRRHEKQLLANEMEEQKKFHGTPVTKETWTKWREQFKKEMRIVERDEEYYRNMHGGKLTGKEIFEKGLSGNEDDLDNELSDNIKQVSVS